MLYSSTSHSIFTLCLCVTLSRCLSVFQPPFLEILYPSISFSPPLSWLYLAVCRHSVLQCVAVCRSVLQRMIDFCPFSFVTLFCSLSSLWQSKSISIFSPSIRLSACLCCSRNPLTLFSRQQGAISKSFNAPMWEEGSWQRSAGC